MSDLLNHIKNAPSHELPGLEELAVKVHYMERTIAQLTQRLTEAEEKLKQTRENHPGYLDTKQVMQMLKIITRTLYSLRKNRQLEGYLISGKYLYKKEDVDKLLQTTKN